ncbi:MAG: hypothetical protein F2602_04390 [Actinobacteria bacterium]|nr:hypothetical protein [Actinomycetota bacterium]
MSRLRAQMRHRSFPRFHVTKIQYFIFAIACCSILALGFFSFTQSNSTIEKAKVLSDVETPAASIIFTQRETLVYATRLAQWSNGGTSRRSVQIARNILAQRLAVIDTSGRSMGERAQAPYWTALNAADKIVASAPPGVLPEATHSEINGEISPIIDEILAQSRALVVSYQRTVDREMVNNAKRVAEQDRRNLFLFFIFIITGTLFLLLNARTNFKNYRIASEKIEEEQMQLDKTLADLKAAEQAVIELQDINETKNAFISTVNHELRTPLTSIIGYIDLVRELREENPSADLSQYLEILDRNAQILLHVVESILSISKIDSNKGHKATEKVEINQIIDNAMFIMAPAIEKSSQKITFKADEELFVEGDPGQLNQVFINLLGNANKFSPRGSLIEVSLNSTTLKGGYEFARIVVQDLGIGIPKEDIENLATRFFRAKNTDSGQYPGTGLGLAIVQEILDLHRGKLTIESTLGEGTKITVLIPLYLSDYEKLIRERSSDVIERAIHALEDASPATAHSVTHTIGGAIGLYGFEEAAQELLKYSKTLDSGGTDLEGFEIEKNRLVTLLKRAAEEMGNKTHE